MTSKIRTLIGAGAAMAFSAATVQAQGPSDTDIGYPSIKAAYTALRNDPQARFEQSEGWLIAHVMSGTNVGLWTFTPKGHPAFPSLVRRREFEKDGNAYMDMKVLCGSSKSNCDELVSQFNDLNKKMAEDRRKKSEAR